MEISAGVSQTLKPEGPRSSYTTLVYITKGYRHLHISVYHCTIHKIQGMDSLNALQQMTG